MTVDAKSNGRGPKVPVSTPEGEAALARQRATAYRIKRAFPTCQHDPCSATEGLVACVDTDGLPTVRCEFHLDGFERIPGQWIDSPIHQQMRGES